MLVESGVYLRWQLASQAKMAVYSQLECPCLPHCSALSMSLAVDNGVVFGMRCIPLLHPPPKLSNLTGSTSRLSKSSSTTSPVSLNFGTATSLTICPFGPSMTFVSNFG